jgi:hypothetical protein
MGQDAEAEFRILVEDFALWHVVPEVRGHEGFVLQDVPQERTHLLPAAGAGVGFEDTMTRSGELLKGMGHVDVSPLIQMEKLK